MKRSATQGNVSCTLRTAFTLVEVMLALTLGAAVIGITTVVAVQSDAVRRTVRQSLVDRWARARALDRFEEDVRQTLTWLPDSAKSLTFPSDDGTLVELLTLSDVHDPQTVARRRFPALVRYRLTPEDRREGTWRLVRRVEYRVADAIGPIDDVVAAELVSARIEAFDGEKWYAESAEVEPKPGLPLALRLSYTSSRGSRPTAVRTVPLPGIVPSTTRGQR